jgi:hypothetical protein
LAASAEEQQTANPAQVMVKPISNKRIFGSSSVGWLSKAELTVARVPDQLSTTSQQLGAEP